MALSVLWCTAMAVCFVFAAAGGTGQALTAAVTEGAIQAVTVGIGLAGPVCLWSGIGTLTDALGVQDWIARLFRPLLSRIYPSFLENRDFSSAVSANFCANLLGLGNAATPMGIRAAASLKNPEQPDTATSELCRLVVMNTASIQLLPVTVAALRQSAGCGTPFDLLPCVWLTSVLSVSAGLLACRILEKGCTWRSI